MPTTSTATPRQGMDVPDEEPLVDRRDADLGRRREREAERIQG